MEEEEGWGGISALDEEGDVEMGGEAMEDDDEMSGEAEEEEDDDDEADMAVELSGSALTLVEELPKLLLALALPTPISFLPPPSVDAPAATPATLIPTSTAESTTLLNELPLPLVGLAEILTTVHVRALECLNNLYITLARSISTPSGTAFLQNQKNVVELQAIWEEVLGLVLQNSTASHTMPAGTIAANGKAATANANGEEDLVAERRMEMVMAGVGVAWGIARIGLGPSARFVRFLS